MLQLPHLSQSYSLGFNLTAHGGRSSYLSCFPVVLVTFLSL
jgi:hypothetical protein